MGTYNYSLIYIDKIYGSCFLTCEIEEHRSHCQHCMAREKTAVNSLVSLPGCQN